MVVLESLDTDSFHTFRYKEPAAAEQAMKHMDGLDLNGRAVSITRWCSSNQPLTSDLSAFQIKVGHVNARAGGLPLPPPSYQPQGPPQQTDNSGSMPTTMSAFDEGGGGGLNPTTRAALMEKLMRADSGSNASAAQPVPEQ